MGMCRELANRDKNDTPLRRVFSPQMEGILTQMWTPVWKDLRKFTMAALSQLGFGKAAMEAQIVEEADELIGAMLETDGKPFEPVEYVTLNLPPSLLSSLPPFLLSTLTPFLPLFLHSSLPLSN